jgi:cytochrome c553
MRATILIYAIAAAFSTSAFAGGDPVAGAEKAKTVCAACHGADGNSPISPEFPKLGGQRDDYLFHSLKAYKSGARKNPIMAGQAQSLTTKEMEDLAAYYAGQHSTLHIIPLHRLAHDER